MTHTNTATRPRMLSVRETARTGILSEYALRLYIRQGKIPGVYSGRKFLVNYDRLVDWLNDPANRTAPEV